MFKEYENMGDEIKKRIKYINEIVKTSRTAPLKSDNINNAQNAQSLGSNSEHGHSKTGLRSTSSRSRFTKSENH